INVRRYEKIVPLPDKPSRPVDVEDLDSQRFYAQTEAPSKANPAGSVLYGSYQIKNGVLEVYDDRGRLLGTEVVKSGDNFLAGTRRILRAKAQHGPSDFWRALPRLH